MKVLLINGSPNVDGVIATGLDIIAKELEAQGVESVIFHIGRKPLAGCMDCGHCANDPEGHCVYNDSVNEAKDLMKQCDAMIVGAPVHYGSPNGATISFLDRMFYSGSVSMRHKLGACLVSCRRGGATASFDVLNKYFTINQMPVISSCYWNQIHGNKKEQALQDKEGIRICRTLARNMAYWLKVQACAKEHGIEVPEPLPPEHTNFIR